MRIYIPFSKITGKGKTEVVGGPTQEGPEQHSERLSTERGTTLPYHEVFARYQSELREAIERGELPSEWQPMIRDYFHRLNRKEWNHLISEAEWMEQWQLIQQVRKKFQKL